MTEAVATDADSGQTRSIWNTNWLARLAALGLGIGAIASAPLWTNEGRTIASYPLIPWHAPNAVLLPLFFLLVTSALFVGANKFTRFAIPCLLFVLPLEVILDLNRFQPWAYEYWLIIVLCVLSFKGETEDAYHAVGVLLASIYFFSGVEKLNWQFFTAVGPWFMDHGTSIAGELQKYIPMFIASILMALWEICIGIALLFKRTRLIGIVMACIMHFALINLLGPHKLNFNPAVWPWNIIQSLIVFLCFVNQPDRSFWQFDRVRQRSVIFLLSVVSIIIPVLGFLHIADAYPAFAFYTGDIAAGVLVFDKPVYDSLAPKLQAQCYTDSETKKWCLDAVDWSIADTGCAAYSNVDFFKRIGQEFAASHKNQPVLLKLYEYPKFSSKTNITLINLHN